jgi:hypothetical protein
MCECANLWMCKCADMQICGDHIGPHCAMMRMIHLVKVVIFWPKNIQNSTQKSDFTCQIASFLD